MLRRRQAEAAYPLLKYIIFTVVYSIVKLLFGTLKVRTIQNVSLIESASFPHSVVCLIVFPYLSTVELSVDGLHLKRRNVQVPFYFSYRLVIFLILTCCRFYHSHTKMTFTYINVYIEGDKIPLHMHSGHLADAFMQSRVNHARQQPACRERLGLGVTPRRSAGRRRGSN